jgi:hypothetical protein
VPPSKNVEDFSQAESVGLMEKLERVAVTVIAPESLPADALVLGSDGNRTRLINSPFRSGLMRR